MNDMTFPIQLSPSRLGIRPHPLCVPWSVAEKAYSVYSARYGRSQTLSRLAERGGFSAAEMDEYHPKWRKEASGITSLRDERDALAARVKELEGVLLAVEYAATIADYDGAEHQTCPDCGGLRSAGHNDGCGLAAALSKK